MRHGRNHNKCCLKDSVIKVNRRLEKPNTKENISSQRACMALMARRCRAEYQEKNGFVK
jgi:hypothetical protein